MCLFLSHHLHDKLFTATCHSQCQPKCDALFLIRDQWFICPVPSAAESEGSPSRAAVTVLGLNRRRDASCLKGVHTERMASVLHLNASFHCVTHNYFVLGLICHFFSSFCYVFLSDRFHSLTLPLFLITCEVTVMSGC